MSVVSDPDAPFVSQADKDFPRNSAIAALILIAIAGVVGVASNWDTVVQKFQNN